MVLYDKSLILPRKQLPVSRTWRPTRVSEDIHSLPLELLHQIYLSCPVRYLQPKTQFREYFGTSDGKSPRLLSPKPIDTRARRYLRNPSLRLSPMNISMDYSFTVPLPSLGFGISNCRVLSGQDMYVFHWISSRHLTSSVVLSDLRLYPVLRERVRPQNGDMIYMSPGIRWVIPEFSSEPCFPWGWCSRRRTCLGPGRKPFPKRENRQ